MELVASLGTTTAKPWANASCTVARMQTLVLTPATMTRSILLFPEEKSEVGREKGAVSPLGTDDLEPARRRKARHERRVRIVGEVVTRQLPPLVVVEAGAMALNRVHDNTARLSRLRQEPAERGQDVGRFGIIVRHAFEKERIDDVDQDQGRCGILRAGRAVNHDNTPPLFERRSANPRPVRTRMTMT